MIIRFLKKLKDIVDPNYWAIAGIGLITEGLLERRDLN
jgi:hypothetical protein